MLLSVQGNDQQTDGAEVRRQQGTAGSESAYHQVVCQGNTDGKLLAGSMWEVFHCMQRERDGGVDKA